MRKRLTLIAILWAVACPGCVLIDYAADPIGCTYGSHEPIFPWYPSYLWNPPQPKYAYPPATPEVNGPAAKNSGKPPATEVSPDDHGD